MRYIGNKQNLVEKIYLILTERGIKGESFFDYFAGTASVSKYFKKRGYRVESSDILYLSYCLQKAYIENNEAQEFARLIEFLGDDAKKTNIFDNPQDIIINYLNNIPPIKGFIYHNYTPQGTINLKKPRLYFSDENGQIIDAIRIQIEKWYKENLINETEYFTLIACLIETVPFYSNISGVYAAFQKKWDPRAIKRLELRPIEVVDSMHSNRAFLGDSLNLIYDINVDILYLDPPYNQRQYAPNYHILETIARYDSPEIHGVTGMRDYSKQKSRFCNIKTALEELNKIAKESKYKYLVLSYNSEGIMLQDSIFQTLSCYGEVELVEFDYTRFKSNSNGLSKSLKKVKEQLYILKRK